jgi:hypothetical protein
MPDPTAHADDMKSLAVIEPNNTPALWWVNPWGYALNLKRALDAVHLLSEATEDAYQAAKHVIKQKEELADYHRKARNDLLLAMEREVKRIPGYHSVENSIDLVKWAVDEVIDLRKEIRDAKAELTEAKDRVLALVMANQSADRDMTKAEARIKQLTVFCENAGAERDYEKKRVEQITLLVNERDRWIDTRDKEIIRLTNLTRNLKRKLAKAEKAAGIKPKKKGGAK